MKNVKKVRKKIKNVILIMKYSIWLFVFIFVKSQYTQDKKAESATIPEGDLQSNPIPPEESEEKIIMDYSDENLNITQSQKDAQNSIGNYILEKSNENYIYFSNNKILQLQIQQLDNQLIEKVTEANYYRIKEEKKLKELAHEMQILKDFNILITNSTESINNNELEKEKLESANNTTTTQLDDSDDSEDLETSHGFLYVLGLIFLFIFLFTLKSSSQTLLYLSFFRSLYALLVNLCILASILSCISLIRYYELIDNDELYIETIYTGLSLFVAL